MTRKKTKRYFSTLSDGTRIAKVEMQIFKRGDECHSATMSTATAKGLALGYKRFTVHGPHYSQAYYGDDEAIARQRFSAEIDRAQRAVETQKD